MTPTTLGVRPVPYGTPSTVVRPDRHYTEAEWRALAATLPKSAQRLLGVPMNEPGWLWAFGWRPTLMDSAGVVVAHRLQVTVGAMVGGEQFEVKAYWGADGRAEGGQMREGRSSWRHGLPVTRLIERVNAVTPDTD